MTQKKRVSLFIDSELLDSAGAYGLNLSKFMTSCLKVWRENPSFIVNAEQQKYRMDRSGFAYCFNRILLIGTVNAL